MTARAGLVARLVGLVAVPMALVLLAVAVGLPEQQELRASIGESGWGAVLFVVLYMAVTLAPLPKAVFSLAAGAVFGLGAGIVLVVVGATGGALVAFALGRALGRTPVQRLTGTQVDRLDQMVSRRGLLVVLGLRLVPLVPFTALNYGAGLTSLRVRDFLVGTLVGILPATTAYVAIGAFGGRPGSWPFAAGLGALVLLTLVGVVVRWTRRRGRPATTDGRSGDDDAARRPGAG